MLIYEDYINKEDITEKVYEIIEKITGRRLSSENSGMNLLGKCCGLLPRELVYMFVFLQQAFEISYLDEDIAENKFMSVESIVEMTWSKMGK